MCWIWFGCKEVEYTNEDKVISLSNVLLQWYIYIVVSISKKFEQIVLSFANL
jgi:hypothetical protein